MKVAALAGGLMVAAAVQGYALGAVMLPDFDLYTAGGLGLFPSPIGRLLGAFGPLPFAVCSIAAAGGCVLAAARLARARGGSPAVAALALMLSPAALYLGYAGIDPVGLVLLLLALGLSSSGRSSRSSAFLVGLAGAAHLTLVPFAGLLLRRSTWPARYAIAFVAGVSAAVLLLTPYQAVVWLWLDWQALPVAGVGLGVGLVLSAPGLIACRPSLLWLFALLVGVVECALQVHVQARYLLPAAAIAGTGSVRPWLVVTLARLRSVGLQAASLVPGLRRAPVASDAAARLQP